MTKEEFDQWLASVPFEEKEPICPFRFFGYCNVAYSQSCWVCEDGPQFEKGEN